MPQVTIERVEPRILAAIHRSVAVGTVGLAARPALDLVWAFIRSHPGLREDGHNIFLYQHPAERGAPLEVDFGVEVVRSFEPEGEVRPVRTPAGEAAVTVHIGGYDRIGDAHDAIRDWARASGRAFAGQSWEIYGDWSEDPSKIETTIAYLLD
jgi:hypothetical protein